MSNSTVSSFTAWMRDSITARLIFMGFLILILLIPLSMVTDLIRERESRSNEAISEVSSKWGGSQIVSAPSILLPVEIPVMNGDELQIQKRNLVILPTQLEYDAKLNVEERKRGIYTVPLYRSDIQFKGTIDLSDAGEGLIDENAKILWDKARVIIHVTDEKGLRANPRVKMNGRELDFVSRREGQFIGGEALSSSFEIGEARTLNFAGTIALNGTNRLSLLPIGSETSATIESDWSHPKSIGDYITSETPLTEQDHSRASWEVLEMNRGYARQMMDYHDAIIYNYLGIELMQPVDNYAMSLRSAKYGVLIIALTFVVFLLIQLVTKLRVHSVQYLMVGAGLVLFYVLLVAFSERIGFTGAYVIAGIMTTGLITWYAAGIYKKNKPTIALSGTLTITYGFLFAVMQLEDIALLIGSIILFIALGVLMYFTKSVKGLTEDIEESE